MNKESKLESLRLLFSPGFDDEDLRSILEEAQDDLDLAIARISEGQTATWELRKPKTKNTFRGRGRGSHRAHGRPIHQREVSPKESNARDSNNSTRESTKEPKHFKEKEVKEIKVKSNQKAGLVGVVEPKSFQKKKKTLDKKDKTSWAQLVKGPEEVIQEEKKELVTVITAKKEEKKIINSKNSLVVTLSKQVQKEEYKDNTNLPPGLLSGSHGVNGKKTVSKQQEAVVMPQNSHMSSMGVQFGSLKVSKDEKNLAEKVAVLDSKRIKTPLKTEAAPQNSNAPSGMNMMQYPSMNPPMNYFQQIPGFGMIPGNGEFQQVYGADGVQGYYSSPYAKFPAGSQNAQPTSSGGTTSQAPAVSSQNPQQMALHQQQFAVPFGYYPYYMPSQYQNAPGAHPTYGGPFVNKNVYHYGPSVSGSPAVTGSLTTSALPASNTQTSYRNNPSATAATYPFVSAASVYGNYDESLGISGGAAAPNGNIPFQNYNSGFASQSNSTPNSAKVDNARGSSASGSNSSGHTFSNQRPAYEKFSNSVSAQSANGTYYNPEQPSFGNQHQQHQHQQQQYYMQHQQPQQVMYGAYSNGRSTQQNLQYWTSTSNGGQ